MNKLTLLKTCFKLPNDGIIQLNYENNDIWMKFQNNEFILFRYIEEDVEKQHEFMSYSYSQFVSHFLGKTKNEIKINASKSDVVFKKEKIEVNTIKSKKGEELKIESLTFDLPITSDVKEPEMIGSQIYELNIESNIGLMKLCEEYTSDISLYDELNKTFIYQDENNNIEFNTLNGYSIFNFKMKFGHKLFDGVYQIHPSYLKVIAELLGLETEAGIAYVKGNDQKEYLYIEGKEFYSYILLTPSKMIYKDKLSLPKCEIAAKGWYGSLDLSAIQDSIKMIKNDMKDSEYKLKTSKVIRVENGELYINKYYVQPFDFVDFECIYDDFISYISNVDSFNVGLNNNFIVFQDNTENSVKMIFSNKDGD